METIIIALIYAKQPEHEEGGYCCCSLSLFSQIRNVRLTAIKWPTSTQKNGRALWKGV